MTQTHCLAEDSAHHWHSPTSPTLAYSHLVSSAEGKNEKQIFIACALNVMLGSSGEKYHISNVNVKLCGTLSIEGVLSTRGQLHNFTRQTVFSAINEIIMKYYAVSKQKGLKVTKPNINNYL